MSDEKTNRPSTDPYKGVRDFYPEDMAVQRYIFDTWAKVAESFGYERYDASILEPSELYRAKGAENEEIVNEQTYTFTDKGDREVTLRPEMTPTVARMVAGRRRELSLPLRWYSIPNLFRYERSQRGRLREHWQLNCDIFGTHDTNADVEIILLASQVLKAFGAKESDFEIRVNDRKTLTAEIGARLKDPANLNAMLKLLDMKPKMPEDEYREKEAALLTSPLPVDENDDSPVAHVLSSLRELGVTNAKYSPTIVRGFDYYTGTIFEIFDTNPDNRRSLLGGGRYDNLTGLFGGDPIPAVGFGMGDVTMRDFLETHGLLANMPEIYTPAPHVFVVTTSASEVGEAQKMAQILRENGIRTAVNLAEKSIGEQNKLAEKKGARFTLEIGESAHKLKKLSDRSVVEGTLEKLIALMK